MLKWEPVVQVGAHEQAAWLLQEAYGLGELHGAEGLVEAHLNGTHLGLGRRVQPGTGAVHPAAARAPCPRPPAPSPGLRCPACRPWARRAGPALQQVERCAVGRAEDYMLGPFGRRTTCWVLSAEARRAAEAQAPQLRGTGLAGLAALVGDEAKTLARLQRRQEARRAGRRSLAAPERAVAVGQQRFHVIQRRLSQLGAQHHAAAVAASGLCLLLP